MKMGFLTIIVILTVALAVSVVFIIKKGAELEKAKQQLSNTAENLEFSLAILKASQTKFDTTALEKAGWSIITNEFPISDSNERKQYGLTFNHPNIAEKTKQYHSDLAETGLLTLELGQDNSFQALYFDKP